mmetsp:Transcript_46257/g.107567  ORF Transcript_46257/g.107567 Transcript_46257/m.107567 type:complete len:488 (-) Transcript_46257:87-1550(-)
MAPVCPSRVNQHGVAPKSVPSASPMRSGSRGPSRVPSCAELRAAERTKVLTVPQRGTRMRQEPRHSVELVDRHRMERQNSQVSLPSSPARRFVHDPVGLGSSRKVPGAPGLRTPPTSHRAVLAQPQVRSPSALRPRAAPTRNSSVKSLGRPTSVLSGRPGTPGSGRSQGSMHVGVESLPQSRCGTPSRKRGDMEGLRRPLRESQVNTSYVPDSSIKGSTAELHKPPPLLPRRDSRPVHDENINPLVPHSSPKAMCRIPKYSPKEGHGLAEAARQRLKGPCSDRRPATLFTAVHYGPQTERLAGPPPPLHMSESDRLLLDRAMLGAREEAGSGRKSSSARARVQLALESCVDAMPSVMHSTDTLLQLIYADDAEGVRCTLVEGFPASARDEHGWAPLHYASARGHYEICQLLIDFGSDVNSTLPDLSTPLMLAAEEGHIHVARLLLLQGASKDCKDEDGFTAKDRCDPQNREEFGRCMSECLSGALVR